MTFAKKINLIPAVLTILLVSVPGRAQESSGKLPDRIIPLEHVEVRGEGPVPVILLPGLGCDWTVWEQFMQRNASRYTMYAVTLPGMRGGEAPRLTTDNWYSQPVYLGNAEEAVLDMMRARKLNKPVIVGHSLGGHLALRLVARQSSRFRGAVCVESSPAFPLGGPIEKLPPAERDRIVNDELGPQIATMSQEQWAKDQAETVPRLVTDPVRAGQILEMTSSAPSKVAGRYFTELMASDLTEELNNIEVPTLAICAIPTKGVPRDRVERVRDILKRSFGKNPKIEVRFLENARHYVMDDAPEELDKTVAEFIDRLPEN
jgi:pimeloyl-ACP methyl ester carboxylesterase